MKGQSILLAVATAIAVFAASICRAETLLTPVVVDRNGKLVGEVLSPSMAAVTLQAGRPPVGVTLARNIFVFEGSAVSFEFGWLSNDCSGPVYIDQNALVSLAKRIKRFPDVLLFPDPASAPQHMTMGSTLLKGRCYSEPDGIDFDNARPALAVSIAALGFEPPFLIELR